MTPATVSNITTQPTSRKPRTPRKVKASQPEASQPTETTETQPTAPTQPTQPEAPAVPTGQTPGGSMDGPTQPLQSDQIDAAVKAAEAALAAATETAKTDRAALPDALAAIDAAETDKAEAFKQVHFYFDRNKGFAWRVLDGFETMDAAIARYYHVPDGDSAALKSARDINTYRRRLGAKYAGTLLMGQTAPTAPTEQPVKVKAELSDGEKVTRYLKRTWSKLSLTEQELTLKEYTTQWEARVKAEQPERYAAMMAQRIAQPQPQPSAAAA